MLVCGLSALSEVIQKQSFNAANKWFKTVLLFWLDYSLFFSFHAAGDAKKIL